MRPDWLREDHLRKSVVDELHARPVEFVEVPSRIRRLAAMLPASTDAVLDAQVRFREWCASNNVSAPDANARQHSFDHAGFHVTWELHTEFLTLTWASTLGDTENWPEGIGLELLEGTGLAACIRIDVIDDATIPERITAGFSLVSLCASSIDDGTGEIATDFVPDSDGFIRFEFAAGKFKKLRLAVVVRRLLEIETYRTFALMGLPVARGAIPDLTKSEAELGEAIAQLGDAHTLDVAEPSLRSLQALSVRAGQLIERTSFRFAASHAYGEILRRRLSSLREVSVSGASTLERYLGNRVDPALATCLAVEKRQSALVAKIERGIELLNAKISRDLQAQNKEILRTIAQTSERQFQLQRTVEGLSVIAMSYYVLGIVGYALAGAGELVHFSKPIATAALIPAVVTIVWAGVKMIRRRYGTGIL